MACQRTLPRRVLALLGPRIGSSFGLLPGNSSGLGGSPGSWTGGGTSGFGLPGGLSVGGSVGLPGVGGGISGGSVGIYIITSLNAYNGSRAATFPMHLSAVC
jgi:hypothetical protein